MNYLQLCQTVRELAGIPGTGPTSVAGQSGELRRLCNWVAQAWNEIQLKRADWLWMWDDTSFDTTAGKSIYAPVADLGLTRFARWKECSFSIYLKSSGKGAEVDLGHWQYNSFKGDYLYGTKATATGQPDAIAIAPNRSLILGLIPDAVYTVEGEYYKSTQVLAADSDTPEMPEIYHMAIVHKALIKYGAYEAAGEVVQEQITNLSAVMNRLEQDQLPEVNLGCALI